MTRAVFRGDKCNFSQSIEATNFDFNFVVFHNVAALAHACNGLFWSMWTHRKVTGNGETLAESATGVCSQLKFDAVWNRHFSRKPDKMTANFFEGILVLINIQ